MITRSNPPDPGPPPAPGVIVGVAGTLAAVAGAVIILVNWGRPDYEVGFFFGTVLVFGGLLMRVESAITRGMNRRHGTPDDGAA